MSGPMKAVLIERSGITVTLPFGERTRLFSIDYEGEVTEIPRPSFSGNIRMDIEETAPGEGKYPMVLLLVEPPEVERVEGMDRSDGLKLLLSMQKASEMAKAMQEKPARPH